MKIGFVGLGIMGRPMALNLLRSGCELYVNDLNEAAVKALCDKGAIAASQAEIAESCEAVFTILPNGSIVHQVLLGENGMLAHMAPGTLAVDMSSVTPEEAKACHRFAQERGVHFLDAPVSGGEPKAIDGSLSFMVGGKQEVFDACKDILAAMGASVTLCGDVGAGNTTKLANQIIVACNIQAVAEAFTLAQKAGVDPEVVYRAIRGGLAGSTVMDAKGPMMIAGNDKPGFKIDLHIKDLNNALDCAHAVGAPVPMTASVQEILQWLHNNDCGGNDHSAIAKYYERLTGIKIGR